MPAFMAQEGLPIWNEIMVSDIDKAQEFYSNVFGWECESPIGDSTYIYARKNGFPVLSIMQVNELSGNIFTYFYTEDLAKDHEKAKELGCEKIISDVGGARGEGILLQDPSGAFFGLMSIHNGENFIAAGEAGTPIWYELLTHTPVSDFYAHLLDWNPVAVTDNYEICMHEGAPFAGIETRSARDFSMWNPYFAVENLDAAINAAILAGGQQLSPIIQSDFGLISTISDPDGACITLCEMSEEEGNTEEDTIHEGDSVL